jgi:FlaA1/EpsC-like NDP-sugar epimerase
MWQSYNRRCAHANLEVSERPWPRIEDAMFQLDLLKGKRILVTGGGTGLGRSMSHRFLELGANVVICGRREDVLEQTAEELTKETGAEIETVSATCACRTRSKR